MTNNKQTSLFDEFEGVQLATSTHMVKSFNVKLSSEDSPSIRRLKKNFNHRLKAIAKLREDIEKLPKVFALLNGRFNKIVKPTEDRLIASKLGLIEVIDKTYSKKSFTDNEREYIRSFMMDELNGLSEMGCEYDEKFQKYFQLDKLAESEGSMEFMQEMINNMVGMEIDIKDLMGDEKLSPEEFKEKYGKEMEDKAKAFEDKQHSSKQGGKINRAKEGDEPDLNLHFMKTYKSLAKKIHPDLEQDAVIRKQKENLMQELAHAKDNQDLFQLISIKLKIEKIENNETVFDENYLKVYADRLLEQKQALEMDIYVMKNQSGHNSWLYQKFYARHTNTTIKRMQTYQKELETGIGQCKELAKSLKTVAGMKKYIREVREMEDDMFFELW